MNIPGVADDRVVENPKTSRPQSSGENRGLMNGRNVRVMIFCWLALAWVGAIGQNSPHGQTAAEGKANPAHVVYEKGRLTVTGNGSSLAKILEQIHATMGIVFEGKLPENLVMGQYGPGYPRVVLKKLLEQSSYKYTMVSDGTPYSVTKVVLSLRTAPDAPVGTAAAKSVEPGKSVTVDTTASTQAAQAAQATQYVAQLPGVAAAGQAAVAAPLTKSPDGSPYVKGTAVSVQDSHARIADAERKRSERLTKEAEEADKEAGASNPK